MVDIRTRLEDGTRYRERVKSPIKSESGSQRWGEGREREILRRGIVATPKGVVTLGAFAPKYLKWSEGERRKPSHLAGIESILRLYLVPMFGDRPLNAIGAGDVAALKTALADKSPKTANNVLTVLSALLRVAVELEELPAMPVKVRLNKVARNEARFFDFSELERLVSAASSDPAALVAVLLGAEAGLRMGEIIALEWRDCDLERGLVKVERGDWHGHVETPKGGHGRIVPMTGRLRQALRAHRHLAGERVLCAVSGRPLSVQELRTLVGGACRRANLREGVHVLRHTFCSHLAMRGAAPEAIRKLAGHSTVGTTTRYMHLSPGSTESAIRLLEEPAPELKISTARGNRRATALRSVGKS